jgi:sugar diacid utilization regulator
VALVGGEAAPAPQTAEHLAGAAVAALIQLVIHDTREATELELRESFLEELRSRKGLTGAEIVRRAARFGCDLAGGGMVLCATLTSARGHLVIATIVAEHPGALVEQLLSDGVEPRPLLYAVLPTGTGDGTAAATQASARALAIRLRRHAIVGVSSFHTDPAGLPEAMREAELVQEVVRRSGAPIADELGGGTYTLLFRMLASHPEEIRVFYDSTVAPLARYDDQYHTELVRTLQCYLDANCNMNATAAAIFAHRHTVAYRLERIHDLTGLDPTLSDHRERLGIGLKIHRLLAPSGPVSREA